MKTMPSVFLGHGSPMLALDRSDVTRSLTALGERIIRDYGRPKAILMISPTGTRAATSYSAPTIRGRYTTCTDFPRNSIRCAIPQWDAPR